MLSAAMASDCSVFLKKKLFTCSDSLALHPSQICNCVINRKTNLSQLCERQNKSEVMYKLCNKCNIGSYSLLWIFAHQTKHDYGIEKQNTDNTSILQKNSAKAKKKAPCEHCSYIARDNSGLQVHIKSRHTPDDQIEWLICEKCNQRFKFRNYLNAHMRNLHPEEGNNQIMKRYKCRECSFETQYRDSLRKHKISKHTPVNVINWSTCEKCNYKFKFKSDLTLHMKRLHLEKGRNRMMKKYECRECSFETHYKDSLKNHTISKHTPNNFIKWCTCEKCNQKFKFKSYLNTHMRGIHAEKGRIRNMKIYECSECNFRTHYRPSLRNHKISKHTPENLVDWHQCEFCNFRSNLRENLKRHIQRAHAPDENKNRCNICDLRFENLRNLRIHRISTHFKGHIFRCKHCHFCTISSNALEKHLKVQHSLLNCTECDYRAIDFRVLRQHKKEKHLTIEKEFQCQHCLFTSNIKKSFQKHIRFKHTPHEQLNWFSCDVCTYKSKRRNDLKIHLFSRHSIGDGFKCNECSFTTPKSYRLKEHIISSHTAAELVKWYYCDTCSFKTKNERQLKPHSLLHK